MKNSYDNIIAKNDDSLIHKVHLDSIRYQHKPENIGAISNRLLNSAVDLTIRDLANYAINGQTCCLGHFRGDREKDNWLGQSILMLDFDNKDKKTKQRVDNPISFLQVEQRLKEYGLDCNFVYTTFSHTDNWHRFRVAFQLDVCISNVEFYDNIAEALFIIFPEVDSVTRNPVGLYFGGRQLIYENYDYVLNLSTLLQVAEFCSVKDSSSKNMSRDLNKVSKKIGLNRNGSNYNSAYINNIESVEFASKSRDKHKIKIVRCINFEELRKEIRILDDFMNPEVKLLHPELLGLATNLRYIEGGQKLYEQCITANPDYAQEEKLKIMIYCKSCNYFPMSLDSFSPYEEDWEYGSLLNAARRKEVIRVEKYSVKSVEQIRKELAKHFQLALNSQDINVHVFKAPPGIGKTENYANTENVVIAVPYHSLKDEIDKQGRLKGEYSITPSMSNLPYEVKDTLEYYYSIGAMYWANQYLAEMCEKDETVRQYYNNCLSCYASPKKVLTTHQKGLFIDWLHDTIIFDEDIIGLLLPIDYVSMNDLLRLESIINNSNDKRTLSSLIDDIRQGRVNSPRQMDLGVFEDFSAIEEAVLNSNLKYESNILHFFDSCYFVVDAQDITKIHYVRKYELPKDKKIIILSATANEILYRYLLGERLRFYDLSNVEMAGLIEQDTKYSCSRSSLSRHIDYAVERTKDLPTITFAKFKNEFYNPTEGMHFGHCAGSNEYAGQDIAVVGTPHVNPVTIVLYAKALDLPVKTSDFSRIRQQIVHHNGYRFWFNTYDNEHLRCLQFYFIESELRQAVGRARPYTMPSQVLLLSNYPLPEACIGKEEQSLGREKLKRNAKTHLEQCLTASKEKQIIS